jgi:hypothetical protein
MEEREINQSLAFPWLYRNASTYENRTGTNTIAIDFELIGYDVKWEYKIDDNEYQRSIGGELHRDEDGKQISTKNLILMTVSAQTLDDELRLAMNHIGTSTAIICNEGVCNDVIWKKPSETAKLRFYDMDDKEVELIRGTTWIEVVRPEIEVIIE